MQSALYQRGHMTQAERIKKAVGEFGASAKAKLNEGGQPEDQLRNPLEQLFAALAVEMGLAKGALTLVGEKSLSELRTRPDFAVSVQKLFKVMLVTYTFKCRPE